MRNAIHLDEKTNASSLSLAYSLRHWFLPSQLADSSTLCFSSPPIQTAQAGEDPRCTATYCVTIDRSSLIPRSLSAACVHSFA